MALRSAQLADWLSSNKQQQRVEKLSTSKVNKLVCFVSLEIECPFDSHETDRSGKSVGWSVGQSGLETKTNFHISNPSQWPVDEKKLIK